MKRKILQILILALLSTATVGLTSCRSQKGVGKNHYESLHKKKKKSRGRKRKRGKDRKDLPRSDNRIIDEAYGWLGTPYGYGKAEKGKACDCSGMVMSVYEKVTGVKLPRNSGEQQEFCEKLKKKDVRTGDLCFFATGKDAEKTSHVGIMIDDTNFIHASTSKGVVVSDITQPYYVRTFTGFGRVPLDND